jgi:hypothetical protein
MQVAYSRLNLDYHNRSRMQFVNKVSRQVPAASINMRRCNTLNCLYPTMLIGRKSHTDLTLAVASTTSIFRLGKSRKLRQETGARRKFQ